MTHKNLNNGTPTEIFYPISDREFQNQFSEIFNEEHYKQGRVKNSVYVDIGANIGLTALYFKDYAKEYYAIEPSKECFEALQKNTQGINIKTFNCAIYNENKEYYLYQVAEDSVGQTLIPGDNAIFGRIPVQGKRLDTFFEENNIEHVDVMKIDVESSEYFILPDPSFEKVASKIDLIIGEGHFDATTGAMPYIIPVILKEYGFETEFTQIKNMIYKLYYTSSQGERKKYELMTNTIFVGRRKT